MTTGRFSSLESVIILFNSHKSRGTWREENDSYWLAGLVEEIGELAEALLEDDPSNADHELRQIASIALNWLDKREGDEG